MAIFASRQGINRFAGPTRIIGLLDKNILFLVVFPGQPQEIMLVSSRRLPQPTFSSFSSIPPAPRRQPHPLGLGFPGTAPCDLKRLCTMPFGSYASKSGRRRTQRSFTPYGEPLEGRNLLSGGVVVGPLPIIRDNHLNDTLDQAQLLGNLTEGGVQVLGTLGAPSSAATEVDWFGFTLTAAAQVNLRLGGQTPFVGALSLYNSDPGDYGELYDPLGYRQLSQVDGGTTGGPVSLAENLGPGDYFVAVSGSGNDYFHPFIADSGFAGMTGDYQLFITAPDLAHDPGNGPQV